MYERFSDRARTVMQLANQQAHRFNHEYIGTEHVLLGLIQEGSGAAVDVLKILDVDPRKIRLEVEKLIRSEPDPVTRRILPQTPRAKKVIEYAMEEARNLCHYHVGTEHILLGLLREQEGIAAQVLMNLGLKLEKVRDEVADLPRRDPPNSQATSEEPERNQSPSGGHRSRELRRPMGLVLIGVGVGLIASEPLTQFGFREVSILGLVIGLLGAYLRAYPAWKSQRISDQTEQSAS